MILTCLPMNHMAPLTSLQLIHLLRKTFDFVSDLPPGPIDMGVSYVIGKSQKQLVKLDLYFTDGFIQPAFEIGPYRLATIEEIIAMKMEVVQRLARKKDF